MLWQAAYAEFIFQDKLWPDYDRRDLWAACEEYASPRSTVRERLVPSTAGSELEVDTPRSPARRGGTRRRAYGAP